MCEILIDIYDDTEKKKNQEEQGISISNEKKKPSSRNT